MDENQHLKRPVSCKCGWIGLSGELIARNAPGLRCPKCDSPEIKYMVAEAASYIRH